MFANVVLFAVTTTFVKVLKLHESLRRGISVVVPTEQSGKLKDFNASSVLLSFAGFVLFKK